MIIESGLEILTVIFWLVTWALLASEAGVWSDYESTSYTVYGHTYTTSNYLPPKWKTAIDCAKASAGIGALEWVLFVITLVFFGTYPLSSFLITKFPANRTYYRHIALQASRRRRSRWRAVCRGAHGGT
jgi:hypothetical protein